MSWGYVNGLRGECSASCLCRLSMREQNDLGESVEALGLAIARFCRNARVDALVTEVSTGAFYVAMASMGTKDPASPRDSGRRFRDALAELAAMARGDDRAVPR